MTDKPMTVGELIKKMQEFDPNSLALMPAWNGWCRGIKNVYECQSKNKGDNFYENISLQPDKKRSIKSVMIID